MDFMRKSDANTHSYNDGRVNVTEFNFSEDTTINDAEITISSRYPESGYAVNDISSALISVESGSGSITVKGSDPRTLESGDRILIKPGEPYIFDSLGKLALRYIATPAWTPEQARIIEE